MGNKVFTQAMRRALHGSMNPVAPMRIAIAVEHFRPGVGGGENIALDVVRELRHRGHRVLVCAVTGADSGDFHRCDPCDVAVAAKSWDAELLVDWGIRVPADVHYLHGGPHEVFLRYSVYSAPAWLRFWKRAEFALKPKHRRTVAEQRVLFLDSAAAYLAVSRFVAGQVAEVTAPLKPRIRVLHNPVDTLRFSPEMRMAERDIARSTLGLSRDDIVFVWVAHNPGLKNLKLLLRIFPAIWCANPRVRLLVVGKRPPRLRAPWLVCAGALERPEVAYAAADALLHPTFYDTFANVVTEAMACGLPVVCSDRAGSSEVMSGGECGLVLPVVGANVPRLWADAVLSLASDVTLRARQGERARRVALGMGFPGYVDKLESELRAFIAAKSPVSPRT